ncbi:MAG: chromate transporter [Clostridia bacterium]|nr:chromate transporter [Clostridia bacterium]
MKQLWKLFFTFAKIGAFTFGGGYAMLAILQKEIVEINGWATEEELLDYYAISQCTPGVIAVNTATFVGVKQKGIIGGIFATVGLVLPSVLIITIIAAFIKNFLEYEIVGHIFGGIKAAVAALIVDATITIGKKSMVDKVCIALAVISFILSVLFDVPPTVIVLGGAAVGLILKSRKRGAAK